MEGINSPLQNKTKNKKQKKNKKKKIEKLNHRKLEAMQPKIKNRRFFFSGKARKSADGERGKTRGHPALNNPEPKYFTMDTPPKGTCVKYIIYITFSHGGPLKGGGVGAYVPS